jgi:quinol-cytochrome oxidoreductase complex cytochrome b subunit
MTDLLFLLLFILVILLFIAGLSLIIGVGWALFLFDLIAHNNSGDYANVQKSFSGTKFGYKLLGLFLILISLFIIILLAN